MTEFHHVLLEWYDRARRDLPWRRTSDPYAVWVSEAMLQQTTVKAVVPFYERWMERFLTVEDLARAEFEECVTLWAGLGYYARCRRLHEGAKWIASHGFPKSAEAWLDVPGVGPYTAAAVASIAFAEPAALVDGNVERVYARLEDDGSTGTAFKRSAWAWARAHVSHERPADWNQALMELGATVCRPRDASCLLCPVSSRCKALAAGTVLERPSRPPKKRATELAQEIWIPSHEGRLGLVRSPEGGWWAGLWGFPRSADRKELRDLTGPCDLRHLGRFTHTVTSFRITVDVYAAECLEEAVGLEWRDPSDVSRFALPAPQKRALALWKGRPPEGSGTRKGTGEVCSPITA